MPKWATTCTVRTHGERLESRAAEIFGKEAALFVPTGTMANTIGVKLHTEHGQE